jgi:hypothetical protein
MSRPEETLEQLARLAREEEALHAALERKAAGASDANEPLLEGLPAELVEPLAREKEASLVDAIHARLAARAGGEKAARPLELAKARSNAQRRSIALASSAGIVAIAAGVLLWLGRPSDSTTPLPFYEAAVEGHQRSERSSSGPVEVLRLRPGSKLRFALRPQADFGEAVRARVLLSGAGSDAAGKPRELELSQEQSDSGALKVELRVPDSLPERGELVMLVGRASTLERELARRGEPSADPTTRDPQRFPWPFERAP